MGLTAAAICIAPGMASSQEIAAAEDVFSEVNAPESGTVQLYVVNNNFLDVNVYAVRGSSRFRLGTVRSQTGEFLKVPTWVTQGRLQVQLQARPIGAGANVTSGAVQIKSGDIVEWRIENSLNLSSLSVWST